MTRRVGDTVIVELEAEQQCDYCGKIAELRPYGRNGAKICFDCGMKPENEAETERNYARILHGPNLTINLDGAQ